VLKFLDIISRYYHNIIITRKKSQKSRSIANFYSIPINTILNNLVYILWYKYISSLVAIRMEKQSLLNILNRIIGLSVIILSFIIILSSTTILATLMILLAITFLFIGIGRIINGFIDEKLTKLGKIFKFISGISEIIIGLVVMIIIILEPLYSITILINLFAIGLVIIGASRVVLGVNIRKYSNTYRIIMLLGGTLTIILGIIIFVFPALGYFILIVILAIGLLINGLIRISHTILL